MSFDSRDQASRLFQSPHLSGPVTSPVQFAALTDSASGSSALIPDFLVRRESAYANCWASVKALFTRSRLSDSSGLKHLYRNASLTGFRAPGTGLANSFFLHVALILALIYVPMAMQPKAPSLSAAFLPPEVIFYPVPEHRSPAALPRIAPQGPGGRPGNGPRPTVRPDPGKTVSNGALTAISKPMHPDNVHQTIVQPASPPKLKIQDDLNLPNLSLGMATVPKKPSFDLRFKAPTQNNSNLVAAMATPAAETKLDTGNVTTLEPANAEPKMPLPSGPLAKPTRQDFGFDQGGSEAPEMANYGDSRTVLVIGVAPSGTVSELAVPPGNRSGDFSIAPGKGTSGSPGGVAGGVAGGGNGGSGHSGDESVGIGSARSGGGGGNNGVPGMLSIKGVGNSAGGAALDSRFVASMVYPLPVSLNFKFPKNRMIVSAGPMGGGGLNIYGALPCGKIYTIFLPMNDSNWTMQYCQKAGTAPEPVKTETQSTVIRMEAGLLPPDPDMDSRYDFKRLPIPPGKAHKLIVLRGTLKEDGTLDALEVFQGIVPQMDEAARLAFSHWKFRPAMRAGKAVSLELLIGIPPEMAATGDSH